MKHAAAKKKSKNPFSLRNLGLCAGIFLLVLYCAGCVLFSFLLFPRTSIAGVDVSLSTKQAAVEKLDALQRFYTCRVTSDEIDLPIYGSGISFELDSSSAVERAANQTSPFLWFVEIFRAHEVDAEGLISWDEDALRELLTLQVENANEDTTPTIDACIVYDEDSQVLCIQEASLGNTLAIETLLESVSDALCSFDSVYEVRSCDYLQPELWADSEVLVRRLAKLNDISTANFALTAGDLGEVDRITQENLLSWVDIDEVTNTVTFSTEKLANWVDDYIALHTTYGTTRTFTLPSGETYSVSGGLYGWAFNREELYALLLEALQTDCQTSVALPCTSTAARWVNADNDFSRTEADVVDFGDTYFEVTLSTQRMHVVVNGEITYTGGIISGDTTLGYDTPMGVYSVLGRQSYLYLRDYDEYGNEYVSYVKHFFPFIDNVWGIHDSPSRQGWHTQIVYDQPDMLYAFVGQGSRGCITVSNEASDYLWTVLYIGCPVVIHW